MQGQSLRFILSRRKSYGRKLTNEETGNLLTPHDTGNDRIITTLERCNMDVFAKDTPDAEEFSRFLRFIRDILPSGEVRIDSGFFPTE